MSSLPEIEAVANALPPEQQAELLTFLAARLSRKFGKSKSDIDSSVELGHRKCDELILELRRLDEFWNGDDLADEGLEVTVEVRQLLDDIYDINWGKGDCLKRAVVAIQSQIGNAIWTKPLATFVDAAVQIIRQRRLIDEQVVEEVLDLVEASGLDPFRGTVSEPQVRKRFVIQEV